MFSCNSIPLDVRFDKETCISLSLAARLGLFLEPLSKQKVTDWGTACYQAKNLKIMKTINEIKSIHAITKVFVLENFRDILYLSQKARFELDNEEEGQEHAMPSDPIVLENLHDDAPNPLIIRCDVDLNSGLLLITSKTDSCLDLIDTPSYPPHSLDRACISSVISCIQNLRELGIRDSEIILNCDFSVELALNTLIPLDWLANWKSSNVINRDLYELLWNLLCELRDANYNVEIRSFN